MWLEDRQGEATGGEVTEDSRSQLMFSVTDHGKWFGIQLRGCGKPWEARMEAGGPMRRLMKPRR